MKAIPDWLLMALWRAMIGELYCSVRAVAVQFGYGKELTIRYYLDRETRDSDYESLEMVAANLTSFVGKDLVARVEIECFFDLRPLRELNLLDGFIFARREYELEDVE